MAREYGSKPSSKRRGSASHQFLVITITFVLGYLAASFFDFATISHWLNTQVLAHQEEKHPVTQPSRQTQLPPKPKFEFYTLLTNEKGPSQSRPGSSTQTRSETTKPTTVAPALAIANAAQQATKINTPNDTKQDTSLKHAQGKPPVPAQVQQRAYLVQVAAFKVKQDAEHLKGMLILKGFDVNVVAVSHKGGTWYRVTVGPYANRDLAQKAQVILAKKERLKGMLTLI